MTMVISLITHRVNVRIFWSIVSISYCFPKLGTNKAGWSEASPPSPDGRPGPDPVCVLCFCSRSEQTRLCRGPPALGAPRVVLCDLMKAGIIITTKQKKPCMFSSSAILRGTFVTL